MSEQHEKECVVRIAGQPGRDALTYLPDILGDDVTYSDVITEISNCIANVNHNIIDTIGKYLSSWLYRDSIWETLHQDPNPFNFIAVSDNITKIVIYHQYYYCREDVRYGRALKLLPKRRNSLVIDRTSIDFTVDGICHSIRSLNDALMNFMNYEVSFEVRGNKLYISVIEAQSHESGNPGWVYAN